MVRRAEVPTMEAIRAKVAALVTEAALLSALEYAADRQFPGKHQHLAKFKVVGGAFKEAYDLLKVLKNFDVARQTPEQKLEYRQLGWALVHALPAHPVLDAAAEMEQVVWEGNKMGVFANVGLELANVGLENVGLAS